MNKENKNGKGLSEEKLDKVSGGCNFKPVARGLKYGGGYNTKVGLDIGYPNPLTRKKDINSLPKANPDMKITH